MSIGSRWREFRLGIRPTLDELKFTLRRVRRSPLSIVGIVLILLFAAIAILAPVLAPPTSNDPFAIFHDGYGQIPRPPGSPVLDSYIRDKGWTVHYFGVAQGGLDIYYGCIWGTQTAFRMGVVVVGRQLLL